jgi:methionyl-tRNA formyltransferase
MNEKIKVVFVGGLTNGRIVFDYLKKNKYVNLLCAVTYPKDFKGARYSEIAGIDNVYYTGSLKGAEKVLNQLRPDLIVVAGWSELIPQTILSIPRMGVIGFHPAKLPYDRGRSVLAWQIEDGYKESALTMFKYADYPDGGDILAQEPFSIDFEDYIDDVLDKIDMATYNMMRAYFPLLRQGLLVPTPQNLGEGSFRRLRGSLDSEIKWTENSVTIYNKVRAISKPYPGAETELNGRRIKVWRCRILDNFYTPSNIDAGTVAATLYDGTMVVKTRDSFIHITDFEVL